MKATVTALLFFSNFTIAADVLPPLGLTGRISVTKAVTWMDGGSVTVWLKDEHGAILYAGYRNIWYATKDHGGQISFRRPEAARPNYFAKGSDQEHAFLYFLAAACVHSFGTADPDVLDALSRNNEGQMQDWNPYAMAALFRQVERRNRHVPGK